MLIRNKRFKKFLATFFLLTLVYEIGFPVAAYALTSGPTAPEATSFEPVDTTDMVNMQTGDFTYNIPLIEVPGPEGGYPLSLSYHAGIQPNEDASWVGLGWTLNPGAITRNVNGYPDDWYVTTATRRDYWVGGSQINYSIGASVGIANTPASISAGLSFSQDTYRGFGVGVDMGVGFRIGGENSPFKAQVGVTADAYGNSYAYAGIGYSLAITNGLNASTSIGIATNFQSVSASASASVGYSLGQNAKGQSWGGSLVGASISSGGGKPSLSVGGYSSSVSNSTAGHIQTDQSGFSLDVPVWYGVNVRLGYNYARYWSDEKADVTVHGSLYGNGFNPSDKQAFDSYTLSEYPDKNIVSYADPTLLQGGAFPDYDVYNVNAQGMAGDMRPYKFQGEVLAQNRVNNGTKIAEFFSPKTTDPSPEFRFVNDFSNSYRQDYDPYTALNLNLRLIAPPFDATPTYGNNDGNFGSDGGNKLAGSKSIQYYITSSSGAVLDANFIKPVVQGLNRQLHMSTGNRHIAGFSVTNESGVTYHYNLPACTYDEELYQEKIDKANGLMFNRTSRPESYAYTWYLTGITGPDYVDRNGNQQLDKGDWGYWISFEYGKWADRYAWRNPSEGYNRDLDNEYRNVSMGRREVYYLNAIRSRSHIAVFEKDARFDAKGASPNIFNKNGSNTDYTNEGVYDANSAQSMRLDRIYLLNAEDANLVTATKGGTGHYTPPGRTISCSECEMEGNVIDKYDVNTVGRSALEAKAIRVIDFNYDYSLCPSTTNSFDMNTPATRTGKLTLTSVAFRGKGGVALIPPTKFAYEVPVGTLGSMNLTSMNASGNGVIAFVLEPLAPGDIIKFGSGYFAVVQKANNATNYNIKIVPGSSIPAVGSYNFIKTKNPPYNKDAYDLWGMYKPDYTYSTNENLSRIPNAVSATAADVWSLRSITTNLGGEIKINYEPDVYSNVGVKSRSSLIIRNFVPDAANGKLTFTVDNPTGYDLNQLFAIGKADAVFLRSFADVDNGCVLTSNYGITSTSDMPLTIDQIDAVNSRITIGNCPPQLFSDPSPSGCFRIVEPIRGNLFFNYNGGQNIYGGGIRVKSLSVKDETGSENRTVYNYDLPDNPGISAGTTSYEPVVFDAYDFNGLPKVPYFNAVQTYKRNLYAKINYLLTISRELPPPGVIYEYVTISNEVQKGDEAQPRKMPGKTMYQFDVFRENMIGRVDNTDRQQASNSWGTYQTRNLALKKFVGSVGALRRMVKYDDGNRPLHETIHHYLHDGLDFLSFTDFMKLYKVRLAQFSYQGFIAERYSETKEVRENTGQYIVKTTMSAREEYPAVPTGITEIDYIRSIKVSTQNVGFDFYSGALTQKVETDSYGNRFLTEVIPAYRKYSAMGLKFNNLNNKNMLYQEAANYVYKVDRANQKLGIVSAKVQTWSNAMTVLVPDNSATTVVQNSLTSGNGDVWRKQSEYVWLPSGSKTDGIVPVVEFTDLNWTNPASSDAAWKEQSELTLYDAYSHGLEVKDINDNYAATRMGYDHSKVLISGAPARQKELAFSSAEDDIGGQKLSAHIAYNDGVVQPGTTIPSPFAHTGYNGLVVGQGFIGFSFSVPVTADEVNKQYYASVWVKTNNGAQPTGAIYYQVNGGTKVLANVVATRKVGDWYQLNIITPANVATNGATLTFGCQNNSSTAVYFDDFRVQPLNAAANAYVYDKQTGELLYILNNNNLFTRFEYDAAGRLIRTWSETMDKGIIKTAESEYNQAVTQ